MIPKYLSIQGLYSYQGTHEIDFEPLTSAQLFGIFGATGSGKSSILEAISYALYGESERLNKRDNRAYNMMNLRSKRMFISFEFEVNEQRYKFEAQAKRNSKRFDDVTLLPRKAYQLAGGKWLPIEVTTAKELTGLSYQNFRRTIIIPQGKFQEFLQLTDTDRVRMLKEIFQLEKYELEKKASVLQRKNQEKISHCETLLTKLEAITPERIQELESQLEALETAYQQQEATLQAKRKLLAEMEEQKLKMDRLSRQQTIVKGLQGQEHLFEKREKILRQYEDCLTHLTPLIQKHKELVHQLEDTLRQKKLKQNQLEKDKELLGNAEGNFSRIQQQYLNRESLLLKARELEKMTEIQELENILTKKEQRIVDGQRITEERKAERQSLQVELQQLDSQWKDLQDSKPDLGKIIQMKDWLNKLEALEGENDRQKKELAEADEMLKQTENSKRELLEKTSLELIQYTLSPEQILPILTQDIEAIEGQIADTQKQLNVEEAQSHLLGISTQLKEGEPCPLCGATHHPTLMQAASDESYLQSLKEKIGSLETHKSEQQKVLLQLEQLGTKLSERSLQVSALTQKGEEAQLAIHDHQLQAQFSTEENSPENIRALILQQTQADEKTKEIANSRETKQEVLIEVEKKIEKYTAALEDIKREYQETEVAYQAGIQSLQQLSYENYQTKTAEEIQEEENTLRNEYTQLNALFEQADERVKKLRSSIDSLSGELDTIGEQELRLTKLVAEGHQEVDKVLSKAGYESVDEVEQIVSLSLNPSGEREAISSFRQELHQAQAVLEELQQQLSGIDQDFSTYEPLLAEIQQNEEFQKEQTKQIGATQQEIHRTKEQLTEKQKLEEQKEQLTLRGEDIKTLKSLFARSGFVNYVSTMYLRQLCEAANHRFTKLTRGSLRLETTDTNQFQVRDYLNEGQTRSVKTLSGGQTFQASLSLALALADQVHQQAKSDQNFFFLDEGFGSQDKQSLQIIFQTLTSLRKENRIVGVISHVEELQQEINSYLHIQQDVETGSFIQKSWEG